VVYESRREEPLLEIRFFRSIPFSGATLIAVSAFAAFSGFLFLNTLYLQDVRGLSALDAGLFTLPMAAMTVVASPISGALVGRKGPRIPLIVAGAGLTVGALMLAGLSDVTSWAWLVVAYLVFGTGFGFVNPPITNTAISGMPPSQAGVAAAVASTSRQVGQSMGVAVIGVAATSGLFGSSATGATSNVGQSLKRGLAESSHAGWWIITGCGILILVLGYVSSGSKATLTAYQAVVEVADPPTPPVLSSNGS
jgi:MFS family permease